MKSRPLDFFTDREEPRELFWDLYVRLSDRMSDETDGAEGLKSPHAIHFHGIGGIGKTTLLDKLAQELEERGKKDHAYADYDFNRNITQLATREDCIKKLMKQLMDKYGFTFDLTDYAFSKVSKARGEECNRKKLTINSMIEGNRLFKTIITGAKLLPGVGSVVGTGLALVEMAETATNKSVRELFRQNKEEYKKTFGYIEQLDVGYIEEHIQMFFASDLESNVKKLKKPLVIMLDTYEQFVNVVGGGGWGNTATTDDWLKDEDTGLIAWTPNVLWVISGRDRLIPTMLESGENDHESSWNTLGLKEHLLGDLSQQDTEHYLRKIGMNDTGFMAQLHEVTQGVPLYLHFI